MKITRCFEIFYTKYDIDHHVLLSKNMNEHNQLIRKNDNMRKQKETIEMTHYIIN
jgi:hypothetical protein